MTTRIETLLARVQAALAAALPDCTVTRRRVDAFDVAEMPAIEILRGPAQSESYSDKSDHWQPAFTARVLVLESASAEAEMDGIWQRLDAALQADTQLAGLARGLRCTGTSEPEAIAAGEGVLARMECSYIAHQLIRRGDLSHAIT